MRINIGLIVIGLLNSLFASAQVDELRSSIKTLIHNTNATVGVSIIANNFRDTININNDLRYSMQSVFKFPLALAVLSEVDKGQLCLDQKIKITSDDLLPNTWSPIRDKFPNGTIIPLSELIRFTVAESDNNACDILLRLIGGPNAVERFLSSHNISDISVKVDEREMHSYYHAQFRNWATPFALTHLLTMFYSSDENNMLSKTSYEFLWQVMVQTSTGANRLKGKLPKDVIVGHKTGTSGMSAENLIVATNDIGIIISPSGAPIFISVMVANSSETLECNERIISDIAKLVWSYYSK